MKILVVEDEPKLAAFIRTGLEVQACAVEVPHHGARGRQLAQCHPCDVIWNIHFGTGTNAIDVYVNFRRKKVDKEFAQKLIHTVIGTGYILKDA